jgi:MYXO-CTERM domain-containing protein
MRPSNRGTALLGLAVVSMLIGMSGGAARADSFAIPAVYLGASQRGRNVELELLLVPILYPEEDAQMPRCDVEIFRHVSGGEEERLFSGPLGQAELQCHEGTLPEDRPQRCARRCRVFADLCPAPGSTTYRVRLLEGVTMSGDRPEGIASILVWPSTGTCEAPPGTVLSNEGCSCHAGPGEAWPHAVLLLILGLGAFPGRRRPQGPIGNKLLKDGRRGARGTRREEGA